MIKDIVTARNAIEALRAGVPSRHAVSQLGTTQHEIRDRFEASLKAVAAGEATPPLDIEANFGGGKSHLLEYFQAIAERERFVTSYTVVSPEMPIGNGHVVLKAIAEAARAPGRTGKAVREITTDLHTNSSAFAELRLWARDADIIDRFRALLHLYEEFRADEEFRTRILDDIEGTSLNKTEIRRKLKEIGERSTYDLSAPRNQLLAHDRICVLAQFFRACGCKGIVVFFDEVERIAKFSRKQRISAYEELGWWRTMAETAGASILPVFAMTTGFVEETVITKGDALLFQPNTLAFVNEEPSQFGRGGIEMLLKQPARLERPTPEQEEEVKHRIKAIYEQAYGVTVPSMSAVSTDVTRTIRSQIRRWITEWDLQRYDPSYQPDIAAEEVKFSEEEIPDAELQTDDDNGASG